MSDNTSDANKKEKTASSSRSLQGAIAGDQGTAKEALLGLAGGVLFGFVSPLIGHPFDTLKTRMQAESAFKHTGVFQTARQVYRADGLIGGFYRGLIPPLIGSVFFRSLQFSAYAGAFAACSDTNGMLYHEVLSQPIPYTSGLRPSVLVAATVAALTRAVVESPLDFIKVRAMVGKHAGDTSATASSNMKTTQKAVSMGASLRSLAATPFSSARHLYHGFTATFLRTLGLLGSFFIMVDYSVRYIPHVINAPVTGPFFKGGVCATTAWVFAFPFESAKSVIQADTTGRYKKMSNPTWVVLRDMYLERGIVKGWYRGFGPGASRSFIANGISMSVYTWFQNVMRE